MGNCCSGSTEAPKIKVNFKKEVKPNVVPYNTPELLSYNLNNVNTTISVASSASRETFFQSTSNNQIDFSRNNSSQTLEHNNDNSIFAPNNTPMFNNTVNQQSNIEPPSLDSNSSINQINQQVNFVRNFSNQSVSDQEQPNTLPGYIPDNNDDIIEQSPREDNIIGSTVIPVV